MIIKNKKILNLIILITVLTIFLPIIAYGAPGAGYGPSSVGEGVVTGAGVVTGTLPGTASSTTTDKGLMTIIRETVSQWYFIFRYFAIALMLVILIVLGIKVAISSIAEEKAKYKRMLVDWVVGFIIIFTIHYFMVLVLTLNEKCLELVKKISDALATRWLTQEEINLGLKPSFQGLYEMVRTRAYELRFSIGTSGMVMYMVLVYYTLKFILIYFKRFFTVMILTIMAPIMGLMYALNKILSGKSITLKKWASEYVFNVFLQTIHAIVYGVFVQMAIGLSAQSIAGFILAMVMLNFMSDAEKHMRKILKLAGGLVDDNANKGIKENLAAATAMKASMAGVLGTGMVKDIGNGVKNIVGGAITSGIRSGMVAYDKGVDKLLDNKKKQKEEEEKKLKKEQEEKEKDERLKNNKERAEKEKEIKDRIAKLDKSIAKLEKKQENKNRRLKGYRGGIQDREELQKYLDERTKGIKDEKLKREQQERLRKENENAILKRVKTKNKMTGETIIEGLGSKLKGEIDTAIWGNDAVKSGVKDMYKTTATGLAGMFMTIASVPLIVTEPAAGLALLAKGRKNAKQLFSNSEYRKATNFGERSAIRAGQRAIRKRQKEEIKKVKKEYKTEKKVIKNRAKQEGKGRRFSFNRFNPRSLETIKAQMKMDAKVNAIRKANSLTLGSMALTAPFRFTGTLGAFRTLQSKAYKIEEARKDYYENLETFSTIDKKDSISRDFVADYNIRVADISKSVEAKSDSEIMERFNEDSGKIVTVGDTKFQFGKTKVPSNPVEIKNQLIDNVLLKVAARNKVLDIKDLNLKSNRIQTQLTEEFRKVGVLKETIIPEEFEIDKTVKLNIDRLEARVDIIAKDNPRAVEETIAKEVIVDYMARNNIENESEVKKEEHKENIKREILQVLEEKEIQEEKQQAQIFGETSPASASRKIDVTAFDLDVYFGNEEKTTTDSNVEDTENEETRTLDIDDFLQRREKTTIDENIDDTENEESKPFDINELFERRKKDATENQEASSFDIDKIFSRSENDSPEQRLSNLENVVKSQERENKTEERLELFENLITSIQKSEPTTFIDDIIENETIAEERKRQIGIEKDELDAQLEGFEEIINEDIDDTRAIEDYIENKTSPEVDQLLAQLLALKEQDMAGIALKFKPNSFEQKRMKSIDLDRINSTYKRKI